MKIAVSILVGILIVWFFWPTPDAWMGFLHPDATDLSNHIVVGVFDTLEQCRFEILEYADFNRFSPEQIDYECGLNCEPRYDLGGINVCEKTEQ